MARPHTFDPVTVEAEGLSLSRGGRTVQSGISFRAEPGTVTAVTGPNGAGKSTLLRVLAGLLRPEAGTLRLRGEGEEPVTHYLGHADALKPALTLGETLRFWADLYRAGPPSSPDPGAAAEQVGLRHALGLRTGALSAGQRRRAGLARLLLRPRPLWLLDEPGAALDRDGEALLGRLLQRQIDSGGLVIAATHGHLPVRPHAILDLSPPG